LWCHRLRKLRCLDCPAGWVDQRHSQPAPSKVPRKPAQARPPACEPGPWPGAPPSPPTALPHPPRRAGQRNNSRQREQEEPKRKKSLRPCMTSYRSIFNLSEPGSNVAVHRAAHTAEAGFTMPSQRTTCELRPYSMGRVDLRLLTDRLEVVNVRLCRQPADDVASGGASAECPGKICISAAHSQAGESIGDCRHRHLMCAKSSLPQVDS
jgi:hypothetical protein